MKKLVILFTLLSPMLAYSQAKISWGWDTHRYVNDHAVDYLPAEMAFFRDHRAYLRQHAVDPDTDSNPGYYHYIDVDNYPEFFTGTLPHSQDSLIALYNYSIVQNNGLVPWIIEQWTDSMTAVMAAGDWNKTWQIAAELGHYAADSHQPLHLTANYNGQLSGNSGIHSRYETQMINPRLEDLPLPGGSGKYWSNVTDSVFAYIDQIHPYADSIMIADDRASALDNSYGPLYYESLWQELENLTTVSVQKAIVDVASLWITAWEDAGKPAPVGIETMPPDLEIPILPELRQNYPNPFNPATTIGYLLPVPAISN